MFRRILVANRGEIACRVIRAAHALDIEAVAVFSEADSRAPHRELADHAVAIGPPPPLESYLDIEKIVAAAKSAECDAVHPGYGFLSENPDLVRAVEAAGITFIGPSASAIERMGDKVQARDELGAAGLPLVPASHGAISDPDEAARVADEIGYPIMVKAASGGGGIGMRKVKKPEKLAKALEDAAGRAKSAFGSGAVYLEKFVEEPHHIEVQVLGDGTDAIHVFERECSVQRRFQKVVEEARAPFPKAPAEEMTQAAADAVRKVGYENAGTVECLVGGDGRYYFLEINRRIQVEHPATEMITGLDLVALQIQIAADKKLPISQSNVEAHGHAIELRVYAEDPWKFYPSPGKLETWVEPEGDGVRVDSGVVAGFEVPMFYDPLLAKLIVHGRDRDQAIERARKAVEGFKVEGIKTNLPLHAQILTDETFIAGDYTTDYLPALIKRLKNAGTI